MKITIFFILIFIGQKIFSQETIYQCSGTGNVIINFEDTSTQYVYIDTNLVGNVWVNAKPQKTIFNAAYFSNNAIVTDSINYYPNNNSSTFFIKIIRCFTDFDVLYLSFNHKYDCDSLLDGGNIEISLDNGLTFANIVDSSYLASFNVLYYMDAPPSIYTKYDTVAALGAPGLSGKSNGWEYGGFQLFCMFSSVDTFLLKFNFKSDSINNNREGWLIDNFNIWSALVGINENQSGNFSIYPNPANSEINIVNTIGNNEMNIQISNTFGQQVLQQKLFGSQKINLVNLSPGIYIISAISNDKIFYSKFIKE